MRAMVACAALFAAGCEPGPAPLGETLERSRASGSGSAGGFSASLGAELARTGSGAGSARDNNAAPRGAGIAPSGAGSGASGAGSGAPGASSGSGGNGAGSGAPGASSGSGGSAGPAQAARPSVQVSPELAAIKLTLLPGWERDVVAAGTISRELATPGKDRPTVFTFHYGYDDRRAPIDRDAYKKFLGQARILTVANDRQRGAAWLLVGKDARGRAAFRVLVNYGGKRLVCHGSLYKHAPLGDARDALVLEAQKICESLAL